ncbi:MAG: hypothetical protein V1792_26115 [Pseudomonadota bacterium]
MLDLIGMVAQSEPSSRCRPGTGLLVPNPGLKMTGRDARPTVLLVPRLRLGTPVFRALPGL